MAAKKVVAVDSAFIQATEHRPKTVIIVESKCIPLIDLSSTNPNLVTQISQACKNWGFFQVINHGVPMECRRNMESVVKKFFALSEEEKGKVKRDINNPLGYYNAEHTKNVRDWKPVFDLAMENPAVFLASHELDDQEIVEYFNQWSENLPEFREACEGYAEKVKIRGFKLVELISLSLGLPENRLTGFFKEGHASFIRINHYPPCPSPDLALSDDVGGLEVKRKTDGAWIRVQHIPDAFIVNLGDIIQVFHLVFHVWLGLMRNISVEHRAVVNSEKGRLSIAFFFNPAHHVNVEPLSELIDHQNPPKYRPYNYGKFFATRKVRNFKKLDVENIQLTHFKLSQ
ncbi:Protein DOWNY MILDEW RESISTANCE 6 [Camellia lanceoleosa]|uniref:Protein DOWNY MILDEW RESISTANCE 6 n=1 Tax=Camellia lanceoleosa TaxID=1840588 RepID=A0ACC0HPH1_9ERIC|nr:Protein DOWNY MILDEW RESISTANCE 6 [Camellia lanceoleosa]